MPYHHWPVEITRSHLQSLTYHLFVAFCYALLAAPDCDLYNPDVQPDIASDTHAPDSVLAISSASLSASCDTLDHPCSEPFSGHSCVPAGRTWPNKIFESSLSGDYVGRLSHSDGK